MRRGNTAGADPKLRVYRTPHPVLGEPANLAFVEVGDLLLVVDAGANPSAQWIREAASWKGHILVLLTHHHWDHTYGAVGLPRLRSDAVFASSREVVQAIEDPGIVEEFALSLVKAVGTDVLRGFAEAYRSTFLSMYIEVSRTLSGRLKGVEEIALPHSVRVVECPGHSNGHLCYIASGVLFAGDVLLGRNTPVTLNAEVYVHTLLRLSELEWEVAVPGHGPVLERSACLVRMAEAARRKASRLRTLVDTLAERREAKFPELLEALYGPLSWAPDTYTRSYNLLGYLAPLEERGAVEVLRGSSPWRVKLLSLAAAEDAVKRIEDAARELSFRARQHSLYT
jgi:glyoxylase-like metal-dependent hydrolase (beta-lactamase superfamily II)